jgi:Galactose-1-phosphate uridyl transferase, N-terminal domain
MKQARSPAASRCEGTSGVRVDPLGGTPVILARSRQHRPNLPTANWPFCPGGMEAPEPYNVRWFKSRWPPRPDDRCEVVLFPPDHDHSLGSLGPHQLDLVIELWAERTESLGGRGDVDYVLLFENRGRDVGATIPHPHGQIYAFAHVPPIPLLELECEHCGICNELAGKGRAGPVHPTGDVWWPKLWPVMWARASWARALCSTP